jgi:hypothetical protein
MPYRGDMLTPYYQDDCTALYCGDDCKNFKVIAKPAPVAPVIVHQCDVDGNPISPELLKPFCKRMNTCGAFKETICFDVNNFCNSKNDFAYSTDIKNKPSPAAPAQGKGFNFDEWLAENMPRYHEEMKNAKPEVWQFSVSVAREAVIAAPFLDGGNMKKYRLLKMGEPIKRGDNTPHAKYRRPLPSKKVNRKISTRTDALNGRR